MAWSFRRSARFGPLRLNFSRSGIGWSLGGRGLRIGKDAKGRNYSQTSIPGTGIYRRDYYQDTTPNPPSAPQKTFSWTPATMIVVGIIGLALFLILHC
jgi:hypothetical protein